MNNRQKLTSNDLLQIPANFLPGFRTELAIQNRVEKKLLFKTWGGLGDQICAEPTLRFALREFKNCEVSLASENPELFEHLKFKKVFDLKEERPIIEKYLVFDTITAPNDTNMVWQFMGHMLTHCVDFPSLCALRSQMPIKDREIQLHPKKPSKDWLFEDLSLNKNKMVAVHAGKHWPSKTFPKDWWDAVLAEIKYHGRIPVLIGADSDDNRSTVDVDSTGCLDYRNKLSVMESIWLLQQIEVLLTNDSSPLHMAASGDAWIGFVATCKHQDLITHWRHGQWSWRMKSFNQGGIWTVMDYCPNKPQDLNVDNVEEGLLRSWLPDPKEFAQWAVSKTCL
jgi:ADP-heptose:LPS heptosyltransferase